MTDQTIEVSAGADEFCFERRITETSGADISASPVVVSLSSYDAPSTWVEPTVTRRGTITVADYCATTRAQLDLPSTTLLHWVAVKVKIGVDTAPVHGSYHLWVKITDSTEVVPRRTPDRITIT